jgi:hypothetical protein
VLVVGEADKRVPPQQSYAYYNALKSRGVDVAMLTYAGEGHAVSINSEESDANLHIFFAVDKHIGAGQGRPSPPGHGRVSTRGAIMIMMMLVGMKANLSTFLANE